MAVIMHPLPDQASALGGVLATLGFSPHLISQPQELAQLTPPLGSVWLLFDEGDKTRQCVAHLNGRQQRPFWGVLALGQGGEAQREVLMNAGAEAYLPYPFTREALLKLAREVAQHRAPVSVWGALPAQLATAIDKAWMRLEGVDYYALLELSPESPRSELQQRFHQRSLMLHPDRHRALKGPYPQVYMKINELYKRLLEAYRVLSEPSKRQRYDMMRARGLKRWDEGTARSLAEAATLAQTEPAQAALLEAERLRAMGRWGDAARCVEHALSLEPTHAPLRELSECYAHVLKLIKRDPSCAAALA